MTATRIREIALKHFAQHGYAGASLAQIAEEVGIKKPSLYAHFKGKDDLFLSVFREACKAELDAFVQFLASSEHGDSLHDRLYGILLAAIGRYETDESSKFMLRMTFMPPESLYTQVLEHLYEYLDGIEAQLTPMFADEIASGRTRLSVDANQAAIAFLSLLDGVLVEMLYGGKDRSAKRLQATWPVFWRGITMG